MTSLLSGALIMVDIPGPQLDIETARYLQQFGIQAVCLFAKNIRSEEQLRTLCQDLQDVMGEHALIALDHEGGAIVRPEFWPFAPSAMCLGMADDADLAQAVAAAQARQLASVGINWNFAPVLDVNINPANPVIGERAFGAEAQQVARLGQAVLAGHAQERVAACVKHFPGHGDTHLDSHLALPRVRKTRAELEETELWPFQTLLAQSPAIMTAHIVYDALDQAHPATLSQAILTDLLRQQWQYQGVVITDSMGMQAIDARYGRGEAAVLALKAGADMVMALGRREAQEATLSAIAEHLDQFDVASKVQRLQKLAITNPVRFTTNAKVAEDQQLFKRAWKQGLTEHRQPKAPPLGSEVLLLAHHQPQRENVSEAAVNAKTLARELSALYQVELCAFKQPQDIDWSAAKSSRKFVILATTSRHRQEALQGVQPDLHLALYNPYIAQDVNAPALLSYGFRPEARQAVMEWLHSAAKLKC